MAIWPGLITLDTDIFSTYVITDSSSKTTKTKTYLTVNSVCRLHIILRILSLGSLVHVVLSIGTGQS